MYKNQLPTMLCDLIKPQVYTVRMKLLFCSIGSLWAILIDCCCNVFPLCLSLMFMNCIDGSGFGEAGEEEECPLVYGDDEN